MPTCPEHPDGCPEPPEGWDSIASTFCQVTMTAAMGIADIAPGCTRVVTFVVNVHDPSDPEETTSATMGALGYGVGGEPGQAAIWDGSPEALGDICNDVLGMLQQIAEQHGFTLPIYHYGEPRQG